MNIVLALLAVIVLILLATVGVGTVNLDYFFGVIIPYAAIVIFVLGFIYRIFDWAKSPVPFRITTTCGQQKSHSWIKNDSLENPHNGMSAFARMFMEIVFFRSLFRNTRVELKEGPKIVYGSSKWLWAAGLAFHYSLLVIVIRHFKYFAEPTPFFVHWAQSLDSFFQIGLPLIYITDMVVLAAVAFLLFRRIFDAKLRYFSLIADYFPLLLIGTIAGTGMWMRYIDKVDIVGVKQLGTGLLSFTPVLPEGIGVVFYIHFFLVSTLIAYFPFSKLMHLAGVFFSPTRNLANNSRVKRHINPWNPEVKLHTYEEYEDEYRDVMKAADMPLDKE